MSPPPRLMLPREVQSLPGRQVGCPRCPTLPFPILTSSSRMKRGGPGGGLTRGITQIIGPGLGVGGESPTRGLWAPWGKEARAAGASFQL